jgi:hypothetical protein
MCFDDGLYRGIDSFKTINAKTMSNQSQSIIGRNEFVLLLEKFRI